MSSKYMKWAITLISDILSYQTGEQLDEHLNLLSESLDKIAEKGTKYSEEDYDRLYGSLDNADLSSLPNTKKAIEKFEKKE